MNQIINIWSKVSKFSKVTNERTCQCNFWDYYLRQTYKKHRVASLLNHIIYKTASVHIFTYWQDTWNIDMLCSWIWKCWNIRHITADTFIAMMDVPQWKKRKNEKSRIFFYFFFSAHIIPSEKRTFILLNKQYNWVAKTKNIKHF